MNWRNGGEVDSNRWDRRFNQGVITKIKIRELETEGILQRNLMMREGRWRNQDGSSC